jgi:iron complex transport system ATP-binding protein
MKATTKIPISVKNLSFYYGKKRILNNINIDIEKGKFYSIIGPNGSGKTTLLKNISGALKSGHNNIFIDNVDITKLKQKEIAKKIACIPQKTEIDFEFSVMDIVLMGRSPYFKKFQNETLEDINIAKDSMIKTNILELRDKSINEISGGEFQRVIIARALTQKAEIILMDEPISQLDIHHQIEILDNVKKLVKCENITVVAILHDLNLASRFSDELLLINNGSIVSKGKPEEVLTYQNLEEVYNMNVLVSNNPVNNKPLIIPIGVNGNL